MRHLMKTAALGLVAGVLLAGCAQERPLHPENSANIGESAVLNLSAPMLRAAGTETITFESMPAGTVLSEIYGDLGGGPVAVHGTNPFIGGNAAVIFDSSAPTGGDDDLGTPNSGFGGPGIGTGGEPGSPYQNDTAQGNILIVSTNVVDGNGDGLVDDPNDTAVDGATLAFDFSGVDAAGVSVHSMVLIDVENTEDAAVVNFYDAADALLGTASLPQTGDNGLTTIDFGPMNGVVRMTVELGGSGAIDNIVFSSPEEPELGSIGDYVWCDDNNDGVQDAGEPGIPGVTVSLRCAGDDGLMNTADDVVDTQVTDANGGYLFTGLDAGLCNVSVSPTAVADKVPGDHCPTSMDVDLGEGEDFLDADFCFVYPPQGGGEGCTPGYWKTHASAWATTAYAPSDLIGDIWPDAAAIVGNVTMMEALNFGGGPGIEGATRNLMRAAVASLLNATGSTVNFDLAQADIIADVQTALDSGRRNRITGMAGFLDDMNNSGCPLGRDGVRNVD